MGFIYTNHSVLLLDKVSWSILISLGNNAFRYRLTGVSPEEGNKEGKLFMKYDWWKC